MQQHPPICALFLTKFDVHTGYDLKWFKSVDDTVYTSKNLEFKSLPSGLHSVSSDTICFVTEKMGTDSMLYGLSVFKQNNHLQQVDFNGQVDRSKVKMYSLGVLIDPKHIESMEEYKDWKAKTYSAMWSYKSELFQMLKNFMNLTNAEQEADFDTKFSTFFKDNAFKGSNNLLESEESTLKSSKSQLQLPQLSLKPVASKSSMVSALSDSDFQSDDHMVDYLIPFVKDFGPLIFKIWKISLLRKALIIHSPYTTSITHVEGNEEVTHENFSISDMSKLLFCISLISAVPKEIEEKLEQSTQKSNESMLFNRPIYNVCVNDIFELAKLETNYLASTTDQIIIEKDTMYDYSIKLPQRSYSDTQNVPEITNTRTHRIEYATCRDKERFKIIYSKLFNTQECSAIADQVCEARSFQELIWTGLSWWATAGESFKGVYEEFELEFEMFDNMSIDNVEKLITIVGYFQRMSIRLFTTVIELLHQLENENEKSNILVLDSHDILEMGLDPYSTSDCAFIIEFVKVWWNKEAKIGSYCDGLCYWS